MAVNAFMKFSNDAKGESRQIGFEGDKGWFEIQNFDFDIEAETSVTKGGGASVGKANPGKLSFEKYYDKASPTIMAFITMGKMFDAAELQMCKTVGGSKPEMYFTFKMVNAYITKVSINGTEEGNVTTKCEVVFKEMFIDYKPQDNQGKLLAASKFHWNVITGEVS